MGFFKSRNVNWKGETALDLYHVTVILRIVIMILLLIIGGLFLIGSEYFIGFTFVERKNIANCLILLKKEFCFNMSSIIVLVIEHLITLHFKI